MGIFATFFAALDAKLALFVSAKVAIVAATLEPAIVICATIYLSVYAFMLITGMAQADIGDVLRRMFTVALVLAVATRLWMYHAVIVDFFTNGPAEIAHAITGADTAVSLADQIWIQANLTGQTLWKMGSFTDPGYYIAAVIVYVVAGIIIAAVVDLYALAKIATAVLLVIGPLPIGLLLIGAAKRFFENWISMLSNMGFVIILVSVISTMLLEVVLAFVTSAASSAAGITVAEVASAMLMTWAMGRHLRQVPSIAAGLSSGVALSTYNAVSRAVAWGMGTGRAAGRGLVEGAAGVPRGKMDSIPRLAGSVAGQTLRGAASYLQPAPRQGGTISRARVMSPRRP